jgi:acyl-coenzyme A synthetase/AMP-(fatty) acid ligase
VVPREGVALDAGKLGEFLAARLARYKVPKRFIAVAELPRTPYGKVVKAELATLLEEGE